MCQPFLIHALLHYLQSQDQDQDQSHGYGLIDTTALTYGTIAFSTALYWYFQERFACLDCFHPYLLTWSKQFAYPRSALGDTSVFGYCIRTIGLIPIAAFAFAGVCNGFLKNFPRIRLTFWADDAARPQRGLAQIHSQVYYIGIYGMLQVLALTSFMAAVVLVLDPFIRLSGSMLHQRALETVINAPLQLLTTSGTGAVTNYFSQDITINDNELPMTLANVLLDIFGVIGSTVLIASSSPWLGLTYPAMIFILWFIQRFYLRTSRQLRLSNLETKSPLYALFLDTSRGIATIRALGWTGESIKHNH
ncbi:multidrug resistance [Fusarium sp. NRRL 52700]|nr:multidrug resistance [Fusarium sp. NRRL 52700]